MFLGNLRRSGRAIERGEKVKKETGVYFTTFAAFRKIMIPKKIAEIVFYLRFCLTIGQISRKSGNVY